MTDLMELASRVEAGEGPDLQLDRDIFDALRIVPSREHFPVYPHYAYTASLDAAMTLVPEEYGFQVDGYKREWWASLSAEDGFNASARTPALALTAACLRARAHQGAAHVDQ